MTTFCDAQTSLVAPLVSWLLPQGPEAVASSCASAACYRQSEDVRIVAVVILELTFRDVERQVLFAHLVIAADNRPFEDRPEAFNRLGVNRSDDILRRARAAEAAEILGILRNVVRAYEDTGSPI